MIRLRPLDARQWARPASQRSLDASGMLSCGRNYGTKSMSNSSRPTVRAFSRSNLKRLMLTPRVERIDGCESAQLDEPSRSGKSQLLRSRRPVVIACLPSRSRSESERDQQNERVLRIIFTAVPNGKGKVFPGRVRGTGQRLPRFHRRRLV